MMTQVVQAKQVLEIGTFTGYSALCFAEALPSDGRIITCDIDDKAVAMAKTYWAKSNEGRKIESRLGPAVDTLKTLSGSFDLIFIDADKINYVNYYRRALELVSERGVILIDNVLWSGDVLKSREVDTSTAAIQELNRLIAADPQVNAVLVTIRDGIFLIRKRQANGGLARKRSQRLRPRSPMQL